MADVNEVSTAYRKRALEQVRFAGQLMGIRANGLEITPERITPYIDALNEATRTLWRELWDAYKAGLCKRPSPSKPPQVKFNKAVKCDLRCQGANPWSECECGCGGAYHGMRTKGIVLTL